MAVVIMMMKNIIRDGVVLVDYPSYLTYLYLESYLIFVIFFTQSNFLENEIYTEKCQFFVLNL